MKQDIIHFLGDRVGNLWQFLMEKRNPIIKTRKEHPISGALALEKILDSQGVHIPHSRICCIFKEEGLAIDDPKKTTSS